MPRERIITGIIAIPIITAMIFYSPIMLSIFTWTVIIFAMGEYYNIKKLPVKTDFAIFAGFSLVLCFLAFKNNFLLFNVVFIALLIVSRVITGNIYITYFFSHLIFLRNIPEFGARYAFFIFLLVWTVDTSSYIIGTNYGRHKLAPNISPHKTIEGAIAGITGAVLVTLLAKFTFIPTLTLPQCFIIGIIFSIVAQTGDLFESSLKRRANLKDSGNLIPGHGGVLDRFDSLLFTIPCWYYYVKLVLEK